MTSIAINLAEKQHAYTITIGADLFEAVNEYLATIKSPSNLIIITDDQVAKLYGDKLLKHLQQNHYPVQLLAFPAGEQAKNQHTKEQLEAQLFAQQCDRNTLILALGGGVVGDVAGFLAATYMRGIGYLQIPTTLLAMVDSSVGGKVGINTKYGKNLIGAFYQPQTVIIDPHCLKTLSKEQMINGSIEALKMFLTNDREASQFYENNIEKILSFDEETTAELINRALRIKASVIQQDEKEAGYRKILNFGHTIGHAIEKFTHYQVPHGYAVGYGLLAEAKISQLSGILPDDPYQKILKLLNKIGITREFFQTIDAAKLIELTKLDKKSMGGEVHYVLLKNIGEAYPEKNNFTHAIADEIIKQALLALQEK